MPIGLPVTTADLEAAWRRMDRDHRGKRTFVRPPYLRQVIDTDLAAWLTEVDADLAGGTYQPGQMRIVQVPKPGGLIRPGAVLQEKDEVVYSTGVALAVPTITAVLQGLDPHPDYAYALDPAGLPQDAWFKNWFIQYKAFTDDSLAHLGQGHSHVVLADIAGFYEQVDLPHLHSDLVSMGVDRALLDPILSMLHGWGPVEKRGLPQGYSASDVLAKAYLHPVDQALVGRGFTHLRWVDDYRVFVRSEDEGRRVLLLLSEQLARRGLVLQSAKTKIITAAEAETHFSAVRDLLDPVRDRFEEQLKSLGLIEDPSVSAFVIDQLLTDGRGGDSVAVLEEAFEAFFVQNQDDFNKSLFRYLLRRLGSAGSHLPLVRLEALLWEHPEETEDVLRYFAKVNLVQEAEDCFVRRLAGGGLVYDYQLYEMLEWRLSIDVAPSADFLRVLRNLNRPDQDVVAFCDAILGRWGDDPDLADLVAAYPNTDLYRRPDLLCSLSRLERGRRNGFYGRVASDSANTARAVAAVRSGAIG